ncbi:hypothetical protein [Haliangium ochraceum]|uniref:Uncharacterized protein n=1 Tax=Haliangium ochraceum (strain DSM 14365 / JCM 11303 / SMP-2) TaxID=502025 RepID=D0LWY5_HALO1|nr:hypothetical protein [Haliangium ochraceum]ACY14232.1 hypothetical protein Hoch_1682 [Haliangium ochraceum DSM 14365]
MHHFARIGFLALSLSFWLVGSADAEPLKRVPALDGNAQPFSMRVVQYDGSTNGQMVVEVVNNGPQAQTFIAEGIYFVPEGDPEAAPQRLGAAGPVIALESGAEKTYLEGMNIPAGAKRTVRLEVFCIDSHRSSPSSATKFSVAGERLPKKLRREITHGTKRIIRGNQGDVARSKSAIQSHMWQTRDADWIELEGERKQEKVPRSKHPRRVAPSPRQQQQHRQYAQPPQ